MPGKEKSELAKKLFYQKYCAWERIGMKEKEEIFKFAEEYRNFLTNSKTEREAVKEIIKFAESNGFRRIEKIKQLKEGMKVYVVHKEKSAILCVLGKEPLQNGIQIIASHIDAPRIDLKQNPLSEDEDTKLALLRTHYYGGIKKYQWVSTPLALYGRIITKDGKILDLKIGEKPDEPVFTITDLLPHLWQKEQKERKTSEVIKGEEMLILCGSIPIKEEVEVKEKVKLAILDCLNKQYGLVEEDFVSSEIEAVPQGEAREVGFDKSMIGGYGQDDRICAYTSLRAIAEMKIPQRTALAIFVDKEEIGSEGNTAMRSKFLEEFLSNLEISEAVLRRCLFKSNAISADVNAGVEPNFKQVHELTNAAKIGYGVVITKFTGMAGKAMSSDANAEYVGWIRRIFNSCNVCWQIAEIGKVDEGGGGTVAKYLARYGMNVIDCGPPLLSMHSPFEVSSKVDIFSSYQAYKTFYEAKKFL
ncbi:MAG: aminopeptidase [Candidatus Edwardsbacteria bacterium]